MGSSYDFDLVCIGSGPGGQRAAVQAAKLRKRVAVIDDRPIVGGCCVHTGTIPSKTFRQAVVTLTGLPRHLSTGPPLRPTATQLLERVDGVVRRETEVIQNQLWRNDIEVIRGRGSFAGAHKLSITSADGERFITAENVVVAVGTRPAPPPGVEDGEGLIITSDGVLGLRDLPKRMVVVGGGVIGIEYASIFGSLGVDVTLIERRDRPLEFLDREIVDELMHQMREHRVTFRMGEALESLDLVDRESRRMPVICLESGKRLVTDLVLYCVGRQGNTDSLNLDSVGLEPDRRGRMKVDEHFRTDVPHIFAVGDVIGYPALAATSSEQGRLAALHAFGQPASVMPDHFPIGIYSVPEISMVGKPEHELTEQRVPYETGVARYREIARGQILGDDSGLVKMVFHRKSRELLGVHAIGTGATELIHIGQAVLALGGGLDYFLETVFNYPTLAECMKVSALDAHNKLQEQQDLTAVMDTIS